MTIATSFRQFVGLGPDDILHVENDKIVLEELPYITGLRVSPVATLKPGDILRMGITAIGGTAFIQINGATIPIQSGICLNGAHASLIDGATFRYKGSKVTQTVPLGSDIEQELFGSQAEKAVCKRTFLTVDANQPVSVDAEVLSCYYTIKQTVALVNRLIARDHQSDDVQGLQETLRYLYSSASPDAMDTCQRLQHMIQVQESVRTANGIGGERLLSNALLNNALQGQANAISLLANWAYGSFSSCKKTVLARFLNSAKPEYQKRLWSQPMAMTLELLSLLDANIQALYFPRRATDLQCIHPAPDDFYEQAISKCPNLKRVSFYYLDTDPEKIQNALQCCRELQEIHAEDDHIDFEMLPRAPLTALTCAVADSSRPLRWDELATKYPKLEELTLRCREFQPDWLVGFTCLQELTLTVREVSDSLVKTLLDWKVGHNTLRSIIVYGLNNRREYL